jgi:hypothetical protein
VDHGFSVSFVFHWGSPFPSGQPWPTLTDDSQMPDPNGTPQSQPQAPSVPQVVASIAFPNIDEGAFHNQPSPAAASPSSLPSFLGVAGPTTTKSESSTLAPARDGAERSAVSAGLDGTVALSEGAAVPAGKEFAQEGGGIGNGPLASAVTSPPAQLMAFIDRESLLSGWLDARREVAAAVDWLAGVGLVGPDRGQIGEQGNPSIGRPALGFAADGSPLAGSRPAVLLNPSSADLIADVSRYDRGALDRAIDQFFMQTDEVEGNGAGGHGPARIAFVAAALAGSFAGLDIARRRWRRWKTGDDVRVRGGLGGGDHIGFPELPGSWSSKLT